MILIFFLFSSRTLFQVYDDNGYTWYFSPPFNLFPCILRNEFSLRNRKKMTITARHLSEFFLNRGFEQNCLPIPRSASPPNRLRIPKVGSTIRMELFEISRICSEVGGARYITMLLLWFTQSKSLILKEHWCSTKNNIKLDTKPWFNFILLFKVKSEHMSVSC